MLLGVFLPVLSVHGVDDPKVLIANDAIPTLVEAARWSIGEAGQMAEILGNEVGGVKGDLARQLQSGA